jgi:hypothetical protein
MFKKSTIFVATAIFAMSAYAADASKVEKSFELKNGSTVYIFKDGKMAMEDKYGRVATMKKGQVMETKDGQRLIMIGNELSRLEAILHNDHKG